MVVYSLNEIEPLARSDEETHSILYGWECNRTGRKVGCYSHSRAHQLSETPLLNQVCTMTMPLNKRSTKQSLTLYSFKLQQHSKGMAAVTREYNTKGNMKKGNVPESLVYLAYQRGHL